MQGLGKKNISVGIDNIFYKREQRPEILQTDAGIYLLLLAVIFVDLIIGRHLIQNSNIIKLIKIHRKYYSLIPIFKMHITVIYSVADTSTY